MNSKKHLDTAERERARLLAVSIAQEMIDGKRGLIEGARILSVVSGKLVESWLHDDDFVVLGGLDSDTDHLPLEDQRKHWDEIAFADKQREVREIEEEVRTRVIKACRSIVARFGGV